MEEYSQFYDVFLSHNSKDKEQVLIISEYLEAQGFKTWIDKHNIYAGDGLSTEIETAILYSKVAAFFISENKLGPWQKDELKILLQLRRENKVALIPILLPGINEMPCEQGYLQLRELRWNSFSSRDLSSNDDRNELVDLTKSIRRCLQKWAEKEIERLEKEKSEAKQKLQKIEQGINELVNQLEAEISEERQLILEWLPTMRNDKLIERFAKRTLRKFPDLEELIFKENYRFQLFCTNVDTCLEFLFYSFRLKRHALIDEMAIEFLVAEFCERDTSLKVYRTILAMIEEEIPEELSRTARQELVGYFNHLEKRISLFA